MLTSSLLRADIPACARTLLSTADPSHAGKCFSPSDPHSFCWSVGMLPPKLSYAETGRGEQTYSLHTLPHARASTEDQGRVSW